MPCLLSVEKCIENVLPLIGYVYRYKSPLSVNFLTEYKATLN